MSHAELAETIGLVVPLIYFVMLAIEWRWPAREFPPRRACLQLFRLPALGHARRQLAQPA